MIIVGNISKFLEIIKMVSVEFWCMNYSRAYRFNQFHLTTTSNC